MRQKIPPRATKEIQAHANLDHEDVGSITPASGGDLQCIHPKLENDAEAAELLNYLGTLDLKTGQHSSDSDKIQIGHERLSTVMQLSCRAKASQPNRYTGIELEVHST